MISCPKHRFYCFSFHVAYGLFLILLGGEQPLAAQNDIPVGSWRAHLTYFNAQNLAIGGGKVYAASENGFFFFDQTDNSLNTFSTIDGLSSTNIASLAYAEATSQLVIAYTNGNVDLLAEDEIVNIRSILNSNFTDRRIYQAKVNGAFAYLSTAFGVVKIDLANTRVQETYANIGFNGTEIDIFASTFTADSIFLASEQGLMSASLAENVNRLDFNNWRTTPPPASGAIRHVGSLGNRVFCTVESNGLYTYENGTWEIIAAIPAASYDGLMQADGTLYLAADGQLWEITNGGVTNIGNEALQQPIQALPDTQGQLWVADGQAGLWRLSTGQAENFTPSGTFSPDVFRLHYFQNKIVAVSGGFAPNNFLPQNNRAGFYVFEDGLWTNYNASGSIPGVVDIPDIPDFTAAAFNPANGQVYFSSFGEGIHRWNPETDEFLKETTAPSLLSIQGDTRVSSLYTDFENNLWAAYFDVPNGMPTFAKRTPDGTWSSLTIPSPLSQFALDLITDFFGNVWARIAPERGGGLLAFNESGEVEIVTNDPNQGDLPSNAVNAIALDLDGNLWAGTDDGVAEIFSPSSVFIDGVTAITPRFEGRSLLADEKVTAIAVDGGNRKWIGTETGLWLFSEDGSEQLAFFDEENSPLLSNNILDIAIQPNTGEVFIATDGGLISYRGTATAAVYEHQNVKVFPNPVTPDFGGLVSISGLSQDASVKITDAKGRLIWQTQAAGGTATWNVANYNGKRAKTGVYLVFSASQDGQETFVTRIAVIE